jgi:hypothetical protein
MAMRWLRRIGLALALGLAGIVAVGVAARFHDGPIGPFPGGPLSGELVEDPDLDWSFAAEIPTIELETLEPTRSRTVWVLVHEGQLYVPSGFVRAKRWPHHVLAHPEVVLRVEGRLYRRRARRVTDRATLDALSAELERKYGVGFGGDYESNWVFRMEPLGADESG